MSETLSNEPWAVLWDVDGTLVDTAELHFQAWCALAQELGKPFTRADFAGTFGWRNLEIIPKLFGTHHTDAEVAMLGDRKENLYRAEAKHGIELLPGVATLLKALHVAGARQAIGSSAPRANLEMILDLTNMRRYLPVVVAMEDTRRGKPDPEVFVRVRGSRASNLRDAWSWRTPPSAFKRRAPAACAPSA